MRNYFTLDGVDSRSLGVYISGSGTYNSPAMAYNAIPVPGRSGDLLGLERRMENVELTYPAFVAGGNFGAKMEALRAFLLSRNGYTRLVDSYHPGEYRMAFFPGPLQADVTPVLDAGAFDLTFVCKPQRWLLSGETITTLTANGSITNPTRFASRPLLRVYGSGRLIVGSVAVDISTTDPSIYIDCDIMDAYYNGANRNANISLSDNDFPVLRSGNTGFILGSGITRVDITPRWYTV